MTNQEPSELVQLLKVLNLHPVSFHPVYKLITGSFTAGIVLSQIMYWYMKMGRAFYKTNKEFADELFMTEKEFRTAKEYLRGVPFLTISRKGQARGRCTYDVNFEVYATLMKRIAPAVTSSIAQMGVSGSSAQTGVSDTSSIAQMVATELAQMGASLTETTTETTKTDTTSASGEAPSSQGSDDSNEKPSSPTNGSGATGEGGRADSQKCDYQKREPTERGYDPRLQLTWDIHEMCGKTIRNDAMLALELSRWLLYRVRKVSPRKLTSKAERASFIKMFKRGVTPYDIKEAVIWLTTVNLQSEHQFVVQSASALAKPDKWDRIQSAMERTKPKPQDGPKTLTLEDIDRQLQRTGS